MSWVAAAAAGGAIVAGGLQANAAGNAADAQTASSGQSIGEQRRQFDLTRSDNAPFLSTGTAANRRLSLLLGLPTGPDQNDPRYTAIRNQVIASEDAAHRAKYGIGIKDPGSGYYADKSGLEDRWTQAAKQQFSQQYGDEGAADPASGSLLKKFSLDDLNADPVYQSGLQFGADQGRDAINARATQSGMYDSGATLKALTRFGNDYGSTKANESYNRYTNDQNNIFNRLSGVSGTGQVATGQVAAAGVNMANNVGASLEGTGNARAAGIVGGANAWGNAITNANTGYNNYQNNQRLNALLAEYQKRGGGGGGSAPTANTDWYM